MKSFIFKALLITVFGSAMLYPSCTGNFDELNVHPTKPDVKNMMTKPEQTGVLLPYMMRMLHNAQENQNQMIEQMVANQYGGYMSTTNNWQGTNFGTFNPSRDWVQYPFNKIFTDFYSNYFKIKEITEGDGYIFSLANIIRVGVMLRLVDTYGPIPYVNMGGGKFTVEYESVQDVYHAMIADLDNSIATLTAFTAENKGRKTPIDEFDLIYHGDFTKWLKYANSLKLRMGVRIAGVDTDYAKGVIAQAISGGPIESNADNAFLPTSDNPYYKSANDWNDLAVNAMLSTYMNAFEDPRLPVYMTKASLDGAYRGVRMGIKNVDKSIYGSSVYYSKPAFTKDSPLLVYCAAETYFLKAEAALQGWIDGGEQQAKLFYEDGITVSMAQHNVDMGAYLAGTTYPNYYRDHTNKVVTMAYSRVTVAWDHMDNGGVTKLEKIIVQKWLANYPLGFEAWADHRRTGYPFMFMAAENLSSESYIGSIVNQPNRMVRRLPYPASEYSGNKENVEKAVSNLLGGADTGATDLWWAIKN